VPSDNTGKQIVAVKPSKKKVWLYFSDGEKLALAPSVFSDFYLYVGKNLSDKDYRHLKNENEIGSLREYAYSLVAVRSYTGKQIADRLYKKKATCAMVEAIVQDLSNHQLIDDDRYVEDFLEVARDRHYGEYKIKQELARDGISEPKSPPFILMKTMSITKGWICFRVSKRSSKKSVSGNGKNASMKVTFLEAILLILSKES